MRYLHLDVEDRWPRHLRSGNTQVTVDIQSKRQQYNLVSCEWRINIDNKKHIFLFKLLNDMLSQACMVC